MLNIPYGLQSINQDDIDAVTETLKSSWLTTGPKVSEFEEKIASYCQAKYAIAVCNATAALHLACLALEVGPNDLVWTTPNTFVASANCALYCGASIDFVDIDPNTYNISVSQLENKLRDARKINKLPKVIIPVDFAGQSCAMKEIFLLSKEYGFKIIEDASHAIGGQYHNKPIGSCEYADITIFSFHPVKVMTTCEGGMALTNNALLEKKLRSLRTHGIIRDPNELSKTSEGPWYAEQIELGMNYRLTDIQCALGISQLKRLDSFIATRQSLADRYKKLLAHLPIQLLSILPGNKCAYHLYPIQLLDKDLRLQRRQIVENLHLAGIGVQVHYIPVHLHPYYQKNFGFKKGDFPIAEHYYEGSFSLPIYPNLTEKQQDYIVGTFNTIAQHKIGDMANGEN